MYVDICHANTVISFQLQQTTYFSVIKCDFALHDD